MYVEWESIKGIYPEPANRDTSIVFSEMEESDDLWAQPKLPYTWPETSDRKRKAPLGTFAFNLVLQDDYEPDCESAVKLKSDGTGSSAVRTNVWYGSILSLALLVKEFN